MINCTHEGYGSPVLPGKVFTDRKKLESQIRRREQELALTIGRVPTIREFLDNEIDIAVRPPAEPGWAVGLVCDPLIVEKPKPTVADILERKELVENETRAQRARREQTEKEQAEADTAELKKRLDTKQRRYNVHRIEQVIDKNRWNARLDQGRWRELKTALDIAKRDKDESKILKLADRLEAEQNQRESDHNAAIRSQITSLKGQLC